MRVVSHPALARYRVGSVDLAVVSDGYFEADAGVVMGIIPRVMWEPMIGTPDAQNRMRAGLNCLLIRSGGKTILVDTGMGNKTSEALKKTVYPGDYGYLLQSMKLAGVEPGDIDVVINSHLHADHCGWNTIRKGDGLALTFERAAYHIHRDEVEDARHPNERTRATYFAENLEPVAAANRLEVVEGEVHVSPEVTIIPTPGHTSGHVAVVVSSGGESAIFLGDMIQHEVQMTRLPWIAAFDLMPMVSMESKRMIVDRARRDSSLIVSGHVLFPGAGRIETPEGGRATLVRTPPDEVVE